ncbi:MAG: hypothetical protein ACI4TJ_04800 [Candidatus Cryptobacteroides sp.]
MNKLTNQIAANEYFSFIHEIEQLVNGALNAILLKLVGFINTKIGKEVLSKAGEDVLNVSLEAFPQVAGVLRNVDVRSIGFNPRSVEVEVVIK